MHGRVIFINADMVPDKEFCIDYHHIKLKTPSDLLAIILSTWMGETELLPAPFPYVHLDSLNMNSENLSHFFYSILKFVFSGWLHLMFTGNDYGNCLCDQGIVPLVTFPPLLLDHCCTDCPVCKLKAAIFSSSSLLP